MSRFSGASLIGVLVAAGAVLGGSAATSSEEVSRSRRSAGGSIVNSRWAGVSFAVPSDATGFYDAELEAFVLVDRDQSYRAVVEAASLTTVEDLALYVLEGIAEAMGDGGSAGVQLMAGPEERDGIKTASYLVAGTPVHGAGRAGSDGNAAVAFATGQGAKETVFEIARSMNFSPPAEEITTWTRQLADTELFSDRYNNDYSAGAGNSWENSGTFSGQAKYLFALCGNGRYGYEYSYKGFISVDHSGGGGDFTSIESSDSDAHRGAWTVVANLMGDAFLALAAEDGRTFVYEVVETENGVAIDGRLYSVSPSGHCG